MDITTRNFRDNVWHYMKKRGWDQADLAAATDLSVSGVRKIMAGRSLSSIGRSKIAEALEIPLAILLLEPGSEIAPLIEPIKPLDPAKEIAEAKEQIKNLSEKINLTQTERAELEEYREFKKQFSKYGHDLFAQIKKLDILRAERIRLALDLPPLTVPPVAKNLKKSSAATSKLNQHQHPKKKQVR